MKYNLPENVKSGIVEMAEKYGIQKVILFGSRARGDNRERSDIDLAVSGGSVSEFALEIEDALDTLLMFDVVNLDENINLRLSEEIERDGIVIYEKV
ncbi:MAG: nucleotidyltransferase domain-containing protein [Oscillospiraceae bacterium]|nr:nucleotidyltransferase domain-containing protein [Oscillospiraceae bacterium]